MSGRPFRFVHASDLHLDQPPYGLAEVPSHLTDVLIDAPALAATKIFDHAINEEADFLVLSGDILDPRLAGPRGLLFLVEQFERLDEHDIAVYWAGGRADVPDRWPPAISLPENVHRFSRSDSHELIHRDGQQSLARIVGLSRSDRSAIRPTDFQPDPDGLFTIAVGYGSAKTDSLQRQAIGYWALGGSHDRKTLFASPQAAHYPGTHQGRCMTEGGVRGCTMVQVDGRGRVALQQVATDVVRWHHEKLDLEDLADRDELEGHLRDQMQTLAASAHGRTLLVQWTAAGDGPLAVALRRGGLADEMLSWLRSEYGHTTPSVWTVGFEVEPRAAFPEKDYRQETILGDLLRAVRDRQQDDHEPIVLEAYLSERQIAGSISPVARMDDARSRRRTLLRVAELGSDLLGGESTESNGLAAKEQN